MAAKHLLAPTAPNHEASGVAPLQALLLVVGAGHFATYPLSPGAVITIGRDPDCEVSLVHKRVSRRHARVHGVLATETRCDVVVEDVGSTNGIVVGDQRLAAGERATLPLGGSFQIGPFTVVVVADAAAREAAGAKAAIQIADPTTTGIPRVVSRFAQSPVSVLILGETGTGKEVLARTLHELSERRGPFVGINSAALSESLLESELFGHERGAFTGATQTKLGLLETAQGGTVFLDEIGDLPQGLQAKLLRAIETREVYRVGGLKPIALDVRFLAATHRDLESEVSAGRFRSDLYYRLNGVTLRLAPLRERRAAIASLARQFLEEAAAAVGQEVPTLSLEAVSKLARYEWPGNVRELRSTMERAFLFCDGSNVPASAILVDSAPLALDQHSFVEVCRRHRGNVTAIAKELATSRSQVHRLAQRFGVVLDSLRQG
jgi:two-component system, NtrC family, response regulator AtoC